MLWGKKAAQVSVADTQAIVQEALPRLEAKLGQPIYLTSTGVVTHDQLVREARELLTKGRQETSLDLMCFDLDVSRAALQSALNDVKLERVYFGSTVLPQPVVDAKLAELEKLDEPVLAVDFCQSHHISTKLLEWLRQISGFVIAEGILMKKTAYDEAMHTFLQKLRDQTIPVSLTSIEPNSKLLSVLLSVYATSSDVPGSIDRNSLVYTPRAYVEAQRDLALKAVAESGYISEADLAKYAVRDASKFARKNGLVAVQDYVVTPEYVSAQREKIMDLLETRGYVVIAEDLELDQNLMEVLDLPARFSNGYTRYLVRPSFETQLKEQVMGAASTKAEKDAEEVTPGPGEDIKALVTKVSGKALSSREIEQQLAELPERLQKQVALRIAAAVRQAYIDTATGVLQAKLDEIHKQVDLKLGVYLAGVLTLEEPLRAAVFKEWQQYLSDSDGLPVADLDGAVERYVSGAHEDELQAAAEQLVASQRRKLQAATDPALVLHLAVVVWHATHFVPSRTGVLRIRGKLVPKILKAFEFPASFRELKSAVVSGQGAKELAKQVKEEVAK